MGSSPRPVEMISAEIKTIYDSIPPIKHAHQLAVERLVNFTAIVKIVRVRLVAVRPRRARRIARKRRSLTQQQILEAGLVLSEGKHERRCPKRIGGTEGIKKLPASLVEQVAPRLVAARAVGATACLAHRV